jgi:hypothetical protein
MTDRMRDAPLWLSGFCAGLAVAAFVRLFL